MGRLELIIGRGLAIVSRRESRCRLSPDSSASLAIYVSPDEHTSFVPTRTVRQAGIDEVKRGASPGHAAVARPSLLIGWRRHGRSSLRLGTALLSHPIYHTGLATALPNLNSFSPLASLLRSLPASSHPCSSSSLVVRMGALLSSLKGGSDAMPDIQVDLLGKPSHLSIHQRSEIPQRQGGCYFQ